MERGQLNEWGWQTDSRVAYVYFLECGGFIKIGFATEAAGTRVSFTDNGIGLSTKDRRKIFEKFHRVLQ